MIGSEEQAKNRVAATAEKMLVALAYGQALTDGHQLSPAIERAMAVTIWFLLI
jgi:hypothetical protein